MIGAFLAKRAVTNAFHALNRRDLPKFMSAWHKDGTFIYPGEIAESGLFRGKEAVESWFQHFLAHFPSIQFDVENVCLEHPFDLFGNNVAAVRWTIHLTNRDGFEGRNSGVTMINIRNGKVVEARDFIFDLGEMFRRNWSADKARARAAQAL